MKTLCKLPDCTGTLNKVGIPGRDSPYDREKHEKICKPLYGNCANRGECEELCETNYNECARREGSYASVTQRLCSRDYRNCFDSMKYCQSLDGSSCSDSSSEKGADCAPQYKGYCVSSWHGYKFDEDYHTSRVVHLLHLWSDEKGIFPVHLPNMF